MQRGREPLGDPGRALGAGVEQNDGELVTADAHEEVGLSQAGLDPRPELGEELVAGGMAERVVDLLEMVEINEQERKRRGRPSRCSRGRRRTSRARGPAVRRLPRPVSWSVTACRCRSSVSVRRLRTERASRTRHDCQRRRRQADRDGGDRVHASQQEHRQRGGGPNSRKQEPGAGRVPSTSARPGRSHTAIDMSQMAVGHATPSTMVPTCPLRAEQVERVADGIQRTSRGEEQPRAAAAAREHRAAAHDHGQQQGVSERIREVRRHGRRTAARGMRDAVEGKRRAQRGRAEAGDGAVEPGRRDEPGRLPAQHERQTQIGQREEREVEDVGHRGSGR